MEGARRERRRLDQPDASVWFHFDGTIALEHRISLRTLGKTTVHLQTALDRAYLDIKYTNVFKHQRLKKSEYEDIEFVAMYPQPGGYIMEAVANGASQLARKLVDRFNTALVAAYDKDVSAAEIEAPRLLDQAALRARVFSRNGEAADYDDFVHQEVNRLSRAYGERSINKEVDQILSLIRLDQYADSIFELRLFGSEAGPTLTFDRARAERFHRVISQRRLGESLVCALELRSLDAGRAGQVARGKAKNVRSGQECNLLIPDPRVFGKLTPHLRRTKRRTLQVVACPIYEYDAWDPKAGDLVVIEFLGVAKDG